MTSPNTQFYRQPYLKVQWMFPNDELRSLSSQIDKAYIDIAQKVNSRIIGIYPQNKQVVTGSRWYLDGFTSPLQVLREVIVFPAIASGAFLNINTNIQNEVSFTYIGGVAALTTGTDWRPVPYVDPATLDHSMTVLIEPNPVGAKQSVKLVLGAGAPDISGAYIVIEWLSNVTNTIT